MRFRTVTARWIWSRPVPLFILAGVLGWAASWVSAAVLQRTLRLPEGEAVQAITEEAPSPGREAPGPTLVDRQPLSREQYLAPILERSIFDSRKIGTQADEEAEDGIQATDLDVVLLATVVAWPAEYSSALIGRESSKRVRRKKGRRHRTVRVRTVQDAAGYAVGDSLQGQATIESIEQGRVVLRRDDGALEYLALWEDGDEDEEEGSSAAAAEPEDDGVEKVASNHYQVDRDVIDALSEDPSKLAKLGRAIPHRGTDGEIDGFRLSRIRRKSLGRQIGLRNGDVVHSVNGRSLTNMNEALAAYQDLSDSSSFTVEISRRRKKREIQVDVR